MIALMIRPQVARLATFLTMLPAKFLAPLHQPKMSRRCQERLPVLLEECHRVVLQLVHRFPLALRTFASRMMIVIGFLACLTGRLRRRLAVAMRRFWAVPTLVRLVRLWIPFHPVRFISSPPPHDSRLDDICNGHNGSDDGGRAGVSTQPCTPDYSSRS